MAWAAPVSSNPVGRVANHNMNDQRKPVPTVLNYTNQPGGFRRIEVREARPFLRDDCPYCGGDAVRQYIDHDVFGAKHLAYVVSPCERCGWWLVLKFWEGVGNAIHAAAVCEPIVRPFTLTAEDVNICEALEALTRDPRRMDELHSARFECIAEQYLKYEGFDITNVSRVRGSGGDLVAVDRVGNRFLVEVKRWKNKVGIDVIWKLLGAMWENSYDVGMVITSGSFTRDARESLAVTTTRVPVRDFQDLASWLGVRRLRQGSVIDTCRSFILADAMSEQ